MTHLQPPPPKRRLRAGSPAVTGERRTSNPHHPRGAQSWVTCCYGGEAPGLGGPNKPGLNPRPALGKLSLGFGRRPTFSQLVVALALVCLLSLLHPGDSWRSSALCFYSQTKKPFSARVHEGGLVWCLRERVAQWAAPQSLKIIKGPQGASLGPTPPIPERPCSPSPCGPGVLPGPCSHLYPPSPWKCPAGSPAVVTRSHGPPTWVAAAFSLPAHIGVHRTACSVHVSSV